MLCLRSFQFIQMFQPGQDDLFTSLLDLAGEKDLVEDGIDLVKVEDEIEFTDIAKELIEDLDEEMDGFEIGEFVVVGVDTDTEEQAGVAPVDDLGGRQVLAHQRLAESRVGGRTGRGWRGAEFDKVGLVFLVAWCDQAVDLEQRRKEGNSSGRMYVLDYDLVRCLHTSVFNFTFSSSVYGAYHLARRVLPCRFWTMMKESTMLDTGELCETRVQSQKKVTERERDWRYRNVIKYWSSPRTLKSELEVTTRSGEGAGQP